MRYMVLVAKLAVFGVLLALLGSVMAEPWHSTNFWLCFGLALCAESIAEGSYAVFGWLIPRIEARFAQRLQDPSFRMLVSLLLMLALGVVGAAAFYALSLALSVLGVASALSVFGALTCGFGTHAIKFVFAVLTDTPFKLLPWLVK